MDNRHLYRGKRLDNGEWVYGYYAEIRLHKMILTGLVVKDKDNYLDWERYEVDPDIASQCTGLTAAKSYRGTEPEDRLIFEGDILIRRLLPTKRLQTRMSVFWDEQRTAFAARDIDGPNETYLGGYIRHPDFEVEIIGTVYDNPELLEVDGE